jgi:hypothetical protein
MLAAAQAVADLLTGHRLPDALDARTASLPASSRAPARDMAYQTVRALGRLRALTARLNGRDPLPAMAALQWVALTQLLDPIRPAAVIVDQAVSAARTLSRSPAGAASFLNATLRRFGRERDALLAEIADDRVVRYEHPEWGLDRLAQDYPDDWQAIAQAGNRHAPLVLRVNLQRIDLAACAARLAQAGIATRVVGPQALALERAVPVEAIPGFAQGEVSVQDAGAQMAARLLDLADGQRVLDACAAPGGKSCHILELARVDLLPQDLTEGIVTITITEGKFSGARMETANSAKLTPDLLTRMVGTARAMELMMSGERLDAEEALRLGLVNRVFPQDTFLNEVMTRAKQFAAGPCEAIAAIKRGVYLGATGTLDDTLAFEQHTQAQLFLGADAREGMRAFLDKRPARFGQAQE